MSKIEIFNFNGNDVRVVLREGEPWFVAADVSTVLGYRKAADTTRYLDEDERVVITSDSVSAGQPEGVIFAPRAGNLRQSATLVSEAGLYSLVLHSQRPEAKVFKRWVTHEVLPTIRKTGGAYIAPGSPAELDLSDPDTVLDKLIEVAQIAKAEREQRLALAATNAELEAAREADRPLVAFGQQVCEAANSYSMEEAAKVLRPVTGGLGRNHLLQLLVDMALLIDLKTDERHGQSGYRPYQWCAKHFEVPPNTAFVDGRGRKHVDYRTRVRVASLPWLRERIIHHLAAVAS
ncbi:BRO family protein [Actinocrispum wychmicini]|uniref:Prophage antirepressor-like protein n=1 Tax=Actinocrispum wychmicini TaxID=1213861 RepID=A0A4R2JEE3_9PSEU|nr:BRO family protein [Actinocrispum wychmicini]TCO56887.1 prophage antirepressor-like protein [Actinocrispum wychmicini]